ncbi:hypothetical protein COCSUDRAFT_32216 [Coccomyxa subellipsoidea C-169]|uniref:Uncharacterized protein n=1 Tax=Coccomyxa subellipsoidea (strain C-169) TaxID=574566 RepID=I0Z7G2_COCSC|nr:hypothetical protein COCSUDRAFT_32216 [Coccomyxa subellipsoidea C-169]EIE26581.1 hypothetical protein COCSUDRAFT_32216 [Coccomyxa subellipsoidea C-169]|eukprot:XP_005651125.1 hypothetical protein COCSUDRAFT_32216 [Coccomyxa subellipsoidea C-169]
MRRSDHWRYWQPAECIILSVSYYLITNCGQPLGKYPIPPYSPRSTAPSRYIPPKIPPRTHPSLISTHLSHEKVHCTSILYRVPRRWLNIMVKAPYVFRG